MDAALVYGIVLVGSTEIAIRASELQEVTRWPGRIEPHLLAPAYSLGTFNLRGQAIPVLDLRLLLLPHLPQRSEGKIAVLRTQKGRFGVAIDDIVEVIRTTRDDVQELASGAPHGEKPLVRSLLLGRDGERVVQILDIATLLARPGVMLLSEDAQAGRARRTNQFQQQFLFFECDDLRFCLDATAVREIVDQPDLDQTYQLGEVYRGMLHLRGQAVPVLDLFNVLALPAGAAAKTRLLVLDVRGLVVALLVSDVVATARLAVENVMPLPGFGLRRREMFSGIVAGEAGGKDTLMLREDAILLSHEAIMRDKDVAALQRLHDGLDAAQDAHDPRTAGATRTAFLRFHAGETYCAAMSQVQEIIAMPDDFLRLGSADGIVLGLLKRRGAMLPLVNFRVLADQPDQAPDRDSRILLVRGPAASCGFIVDGTDAVEYAFVRKPGQDRSGPVAGGTLELGRGAVATASTLVPVDTLEGHRLMPVLDLRLLAGHLEQALAA